MPTHTEIEEGFEAVRRYRARVKYLSGQAIGEIHGFEQILQRPETPDEQLLALPLSELYRIADELKEQALSQRQTQQAD